MSEQFIHIASQRDDDPSNFSAEISPPVYLDPALRHEIALVSISHVASTFTLPYPVRLHYLLEDSEDLSSVELPAGCYDGVGEMLARLNWQLRSEQCEALLDESGLETSHTQQQQQLITLSLDPNTQRVHFALGSQCSRMEFVDELLAEILGVGEQRCFTERIGEFESPVRDPNCDGDLLVVECEQVERRVFNGLYVPVLQLLPQQNRVWGRRLHKDYKNLVFCALQASHRLQHLSIRLRSIANSKLPVKPLLGPTVLTLCVKSSWTFNK
jgi:hypothetical protein